jgi:hypothetical protein
MRIGTTLLAAGAVGLAGLVFASVAEAGTPWSCVCDGKTKRFIGATRACELDMYQRTHKSLDGYKLRGPRCTRADFIAWNSQACREEGCKPPKR